ncbi:MAG: InlB B-repeat-containing protein [Clostridia bacterium]|nr:InlB B-repeat-containing protein [Clostridia bacterium]
MKTAKKMLYAAMSVILAAVFIISSVPVSRAAGVMRMLIDGIDYYKEYTDLGSLALSHWHYDASEDVLTLENFGTTLKPKSELFVYPYSGNLTIKLKGDNYIHSSAKNAMIIIGNVKFTGDGSLTIVCDNTYAINTDYKVSITESASLNINALAGVMAIKGVDINTTGNVNIHTSTRCMYTFGDLNVTSGRVRLTGSNGFYSSKGNVYLSGGSTDFEVKSTVKAFDLYGEEAFVEWSANGKVGAGSSSPGSKITEYSGEKYFRATFEGVPMLNPPRKIYWDDTVIDTSSGMTNPVARWNPVGNASGYVVNLYYLNDVGYKLKESFTVTDALSCNFGGHFTSYGKYYFTVQALGDGTNFLTSAESPKSADFYMFTGDVASRFYVTLPESEYFKVIPESGSTVVYYGEDYSFTVEVDPAYTQSEILVWANKARVALRGGKYTVDNVTENIVITIGELSVNTYTVNLPESEAFTIYPLPEYSTEVEYGGSFAFSVELADIYMNSDITVTSNGEKLKAKYGIIYTISNITEDQTVEISGLVRENYDVTFRNVNGSVISTQIVEHGSAASQPSDPIPPEGMTFVGWTDKDGKTFDFSTQIVDQTDVYARFVTAKDSDGYYLISNLSELIWFRDEVKFGNTAINGRLTADIEMNDGKYALVGGVVSFYSDAEIWEPIGGYDYNNELSYVKFYEGKFDGGGHTLSGFYIKHDAMAANASDLGIFGIVTETAAIRDLNVTRSYFEGYGRIGSIVGQSQGAVNGCSADCILVGVENVGGIVGTTSADINNCKFNGRVTVQRYGSSKSYIGGFNAGGIAGSVTGDDVVIGLCENTSSVKSYDYAGGIIGVVNCESITVFSCANSGAVNADLNAGGIIASAKSAQIMGTVNSADVSGGTYAGGILADGTLSGTLNVNEGDVSADVAGGILGIGSLDMNYFYNSGDVNGDVFAGGIAGVASTVNATQAHSYAQLKGKNIDCVCPSAESVTAASLYYCDRFGSSAYGTAADYTWFYSGYLSGIMNRENGSDFWSHNGWYPVFADKDNPAFNFALKESDVKGTYLIENERDLHLVSAFVNNEEDYNYGSYIVTADITLHSPDAENNFIPLGSETKPFEGAFYGGYHTIKNVNISGNNNVGFFGYAVNSLIETIVLENADISGVNNVGAVVGYSDSCYVSECSVVGGTVNGNLCVGGVVGFSNGYLYYCNNSSEVVGQVAYGGILGSNDDGTVTCCYNTGAVAGSVSATEGGGIVGRNFGTVTYCGNTGAVSGVEYVGGVVGTSFGDMYSVYNGGMVTASSYFGSICSEYDETYQADLCYYLEGTAGDGASVVGTEQIVYQVTNGATAYFLNANGTELIWAQGDSHPVIAKADSSDAVKYTVTFTVLDETYLMAATYQGGKVATPPEPVLRGYQFVRWDTSFDYVVANMTVRAIFDEPGLVSFLPTSFLKINHTDEGSYIYGIYPSFNMTANQLKSHISNTNIQIFDQDIIFELEGTDRIYTGVTVVLFDDDGTWLHIANVVIYGDVNSDGRIDHTDAFFVNLLADGALYPEDFTYAQYLAADVNHDGTVDKADSLFLQNYCIKNTFINQLPN